jgi:hypothetical protein
VNRERLEHVIWQYFPERGPEAGKAVDAILAAADDYAARVAEETARPPYKTRRERQQEASAL